MRSVPNILDRPSVHLLCAGVSAHNLSGINAQQVLSRIEIGDDEALKLFLSSMASRPAKGAAIARIVTMFRASASHLGCVGVSRSDSEFVECLIFCLTGVKTCFVCFWRY